MFTAKVFTSGGSQAVRLPKDCRFEDSEVLVNRVGRALILVPKDDDWEMTLRGLDMFTEDFLRDGVNDLPLQERPEL